MARLPRLYAPGFPQLVYAGLAIASGPSDPEVSHLLYLDLIRWMGESASREGVAIHGWALTPRSIVLLATPNDGQGIPKLIQSLGRHLATRLKAGSVFSGRYRSTIVEPGHWLLPALIWLEREPVRAGLATDPELWPWSSAANHAGSPGVAPAWLAQHVDYWACGNTPFDRQAIYRKQLQEGNSPGIDQTIEKSLRGQWALGRESFLVELAPVASRKIVPSPRGRPKKAPH
jgi:putative transposase